MNNVKTDTVQGHLRVNEEGLVVIDFDRWIYQLIMNPQQARELGKLLKAASCVVVDAGAHVKVLPSPETPAQETVQKKDSGAVEGGGDNNQPGGAA